MITAEAGLWLIWRQVIETQYPVMILAIIAIAFLAVVAGLMIALAALYLARRKVRKEIGLWIRHNRYKPPPPERKFHF